MNKYYVAMIVDEDILHDLECIGGSRIDYIGEPIEITSEMLEEISEAMHETVKS